MAAAVGSVALYLRVSTADQDLAGQERELRDYARSRAWSVVKVYAEKVTATGKVEREAYEQLLADARTRPEWRRVLVWALDRWSRDPSFVKAVGSIEELEANGLLFSSMKEPTLDSSDDGSPNLGRDLLRGILPTIAAFESRRRSERTRLAMAEIKSGRRRTRTGRPPGRPRRVTPEVETRIRELRWEKGLPWKTVAQYVHLPAGTCSKVPRAPPAGTPRSEKGADAFGEPVSGSVALPGAAPPA